MQSKLYLLLFPFVMGTQLCATKGAELRDQFIIKEKESIKTMLNQKKSGQFSIKGQSAFKLSWFEAPMFSSVFAVSLAEMWPFARDAYTPVEIDFLKAHPEVVGAEPYYKLFENLFEKGPENVDWLIAQEKMQSILQGHFVFDMEKIPQAVLDQYKNDQTFFVQVKDSLTEKPLGFIAFLRRASYPVGTIKVMYLAVDVRYQSRGLGRLLMSSIFKIVPNLQRLFLCTRVTNAVALGAYARWGFVKDSNPILDHPFNLDHWTFMEYKPAESSGLQQVTDGLVE